MDHSIAAQFIAETNLPTTGGYLVVRAYRNSTTGQEPLAICSPGFSAQSLKPPLVRIHSACFTSEVLGSLKCDCAQQLEHAIALLHQEPGVVIYLPQEGRGIGIANKVAAYALQEQGLDTVDANRALHFPDDSRSYEDAITILRDLDLSIIRLITNNPDKVSALSQAGITIAEQISIDLPISEQAMDYLSTKIERMGHTPLKQPYRSTYEDS